MRVIGVDYGAARTGVAVSDLLGITAQGVKTIHGRNAQKVAEEVAQIVAEYQAELVILGLPKNMNNTIGERGEATLAFAQLLQSKLSCPIQTWDERLTTVSAIRTLNETNTRGAKRKAVVDTVAAAMILQNYLDYKGGTTT